jgi:N-acetylneuraminic acid mutarotase
MGFIPLISNNTISNDLANSVLPNDSEGPTLASISGFEEPDGRANLMMAYDSESDITVIYGGWNEPEPFELGDTWSYDFNTNKFVNMTPSSAPPVREVASMVYDSQSDRIVLFGGLEDYNSNIQRNDTWTYDYNTNTWTEMSPTTAPSIRDAYGMVYDSESDRIILFGGLGYLNDTWSYDLDSNAWTQMSPATSPSGRYFPAMTYDAESDIVILFGGRSAAAKESDTWAYDYNTDTWTELAPSTHPVGRRAHFMTYDSESDRTVLFGGSDDADDALDDTWLFDYNSISWVQAAPDYYPSGKLRHSMVYDSESDIIVTFGGTELSYYDGEMNTDDITWAYDTNSDHWRQMSPITQSERNEVMMAYDSESNMTIIFGGRDMLPGDERAGMGDTWAYDASIDAYFNMSPIITPPSKSLGDMVYDSQSDLCVMFGGLENPMVTVPNAETWLYDFNTNTWSNAAPAVAPSARFVHRMAYDAKSDRTILFGGHDGGVLLSETWAYDVESNLWEELSPASAPHARVDHSMTYDWESDRVIFFGGQNESYTLQNNDTWAYDYDTDTWQEMSPTIAPSLRTLTAMVYDNESDTVVLFGGYGPSVLVPLEDTWLYDFNSDTWTQATPATHPSQRHRHRAVYDHQIDAVVIFGGITGAWNGPDNDIETDTTWLYDANADTWTKMAEIPRPLDIPTTTTTTTTTSTSTTTPTTAPPPPLELIVMAAGGLVIVLLVVLIVRQRR